MALVMSPGKELCIDARPNPVVFDRSRTAVIVVDMQNDFAAPTASLLVLELLVCWISDSATLLAALS